MEYAPRGKQARGDVKEAGPNKTVNEAIFAYVHHQSTKYGKVI